MGEDSFLKWLIGVLFSGAGTTWLSNLLKKKDKIDKSSAVESVQSEVEPVPDKTQQDYKTRLGQRHLSIRTAILGLSDRKMADFYGFETVSELLELEAGTREFPKSALMSLCEFFFLKETMFDLDVPLRFPLKTFSLHHEEIERFLANGFRPVIACCPNDREFDLHCEIMMCKSENGFYRVVSSSRPGRFKSGHGGKNNVEQLIHAMIKTGKFESEASIVKVDSDQWSKIASREFCQNIENHESDWECQEIFDKWYFQYGKKFGAELCSSFVTGSLLQ